MKKLKKILVDWVIIYSLITLLLYGLNQWLLAYPLYIRTLVLSGLMVFTLQYLVFPTIQKIRNHKIK